MNEKIEGVINALLHKIGSLSDSQENMRNSQAVLNLMHAQSVYTHTQATKKENGL